jgi:hypothetical protein
MNWPAVRLLESVLTQWRMGPGGPVGLDYCAIYPLMDRMRLSDADWHALFADIGVLELAALDQLAKNREEA